MSLQKIRRSTAAGSSALVAAALLLGATAPTAASAETACTLLASPVYQLVNPTTAKSLLTPWANERTSAATYGYTTDRGAYLKGSLNTGTGLVATKRMYNPKTYDFTWAATSTDVTALTAAGYSVQHTEFYASPTALSCTVPVNRLAKGSTTRLATPADAQALKAAGWTDRGVAFHAPSAVATATPQPTPTTTSTTPTSTPTTALSPADADGKFSLAIYPDTQNEVYSATDPKLSNRNSYVVAQRAARDIRYVLHVGDVVSWDTATDANPTYHVQYDNASAGMKNLEAAGIPWAAAIGNHDTYAVGPTSGSARPGVVTSVAVRDTRTFNSYFSTARFKNIAGTFEAGKVDNAYRTFEAGGKKWLILNLELWPRAAAVTWAKGVVAANPDRNVIVLTHSYLNGNGTIYGSNGGYGATSPQYLYDNLIKLYPNIKMVFSGHVNPTANGVRTDTGVNGNKIVSMLSSWHSGTTNHVRFLEIDTARGTVSTDVYAPLTSTAYPTYTTSVSGIAWK